METPARLIESINDLRIEAEGDEETRVRLKRARAALAEALAHVDRSETT